MLKFFVTIVLICTLFLFGAIKPVQAGPDAPSNSDQLCLNIIGSTNKIRYCRNRALSSQNPSVRRAVIVIHGSGSKAKEYYEDKIRPYVPNDVLSYTNILVPQFLQDDGEGDTVLQKLGLPDDYLYWSGGWRQCNSSKNRGGVSSCAMVDFIVRRLIENNQNLEHIVVIGHSGGGQFVNRYAAGTNIESYALENHVTMSYGVSASGSFVFLNRNRPNSVSGCSGYNDWKHGLDNLNTYMNSSSGRSASKIIKRLLTRKIYYFVGSNDTTPYPTNPNDPSYDCKVNAQGTNHVNHMWNYRNHLKEVWSHSSYESFCPYLNHADRDAFVELPGIGHNSNELLRSTHAKNIMYYWD